MMTDDLRLEMKNRVLSIKDLPTLPKVLEDVSRLVDDPDSSMDQIARLISKDQVLSAKILRMVNSPIYGLTGKIGSIQHALVMLGINVIRGVIISTSVFEVMNSTMAGLWDHSVGCALACGEIAKHARFKDPEEYSVAGLLHDLGKVVVAVQLPDLKDDVDRRRVQEDISFIEAEKLTLGVTHERVNHWLADHWMLPVVIRDGMAFHHRPAAAEHYPVMASVVHLGNFLVRVFEYGSGGDDMAPFLDPKAMRILKFSFKDLTAFMDNLFDRFLEVADISFA